MSLGAASSTVASAWPCSKPNRQGRTMDCGNTSISCSTNAATKVMPTSATAVSQTQVLSPSSSGRHRKKSTWRYLSVDTAPSFPLSSLPQSRKRKLPPSPPPVENPSALRSGGNIRREDGSGWQQSALDQMAQLPRDREHLGTPPRQGAVSSSLSDVYRPSSVFRPFPPLGAAPAAVGPLNPTPECSAISEEDQKYDSDGSTVTVRCRSRSRSYSRSSSPSRSPSLWSDVSLTPSRSPSPSDSAGANSANGTNVTTGAAVGGSPQHLTDGGGTLQQRVQFVPFANPSSEHGCTLGFIHGFLD